MEKQQAKSFKLTDRDIKNIEKLQKKWGDNASQVIKRAIQIAHDIEYPTKRKSKL